MFAICKNNNNNNNSNKITIQIYSCYGICINKMGLSLTLCVFAYNIFFSQFFMQKIAFIFHYCDCIVAHQIILLQHAVHVGGHFSKVPK